MNLHLIAAKPGADLSNIDGSSSSSGGSTTASTPPPLLLPSPVETMMSGDMGADIAALAVKSGQVERELDTKATETEDTIQDEADQAQVATMHDEATTMRSGAWESGLMQVGAGACEIGAAGFSSAKAGAPPPKIVGILKGFADGLNGGGTIAGGLSKAAATDTEALATAQKAIADSAQRSGQTARDAQKADSDFVQAAIDFYREYQSTKAQAQAAALHGA